MSLGFVREKSKEIKKRGKGNLKKYCQRHYVVPFLVLKKQRVWDFLRNEH